VKLKVQEIRWRWNEMGMLMKYMKHEMKGVSSTKYNEVIIRQEDTKQRQKHKDKVLKHIRNQSQYFKMHMTHNFHIMTILK
jgi:hypothetical protein